MNDIKNKILNSIFGIISVAIPILLYKKIILATIALTLLAIINLIIWKSKVMWKIFIFASIFGAAAEMIAIYYGVWTYTKPNLINIPLWLIPLWGCAGIFLYRAGIDFRSRKK